MVALVPLVKGLQAQSTATSCSLVSLVVVVAAWR